LQGLLVELEPAAEAEGEVSDRPGVGRGVRVIRLERIRERLDRRDEGSLQALGLVADRLVEKRVLDHRRSVWREDLEQANVVRVGELPVPRRRNEELARPDVDAAAVAVEERAELTHDRLADRRHVVQPAELPGEALKQLQMRDRAYVLAPAGLAASVGPHQRLALVHHDAVLALG